MLTVLLLLVLLVLRKRIQLVVTLFTEAGKAVHNMPLLLIQPLVVRIDITDFISDPIMFSCFLTFIALLIIGVAWTFGLLWIESSGVPVKDQTTGFVTFQKTPIIWAMRQVTRTLLLLLF